MRVPVRILLACVSLVSVSAAQAQDFTYPGSGVYPNESDNMGYACPPGSILARGYDGNPACIVPNYLTYHNYPNYDYPASPRRDFDRREEQRPLPGGFTSGLGASARAQQEELRQQAIRQQHPLPPGGWR